jgi:hypothetical protein
LEPSRTTSDGINAARNTLKLASSRTPANTSKPSRSRMADSCRDVLCCHRRLLHRILSRNLRLVPSQRPDRKATPRSRPLGCLRCAECLAASVPPVWLNEFGAVRRRRVASSPCTELTARPLLAATLGSQLLLRKAEV